MISRFRWKKIWKMSEGDWLFKGTQNLMECCCSFLQWNHLYVKCSYFDHHRRCFLLFNFKDRKLLQHWPCPMWTINHEIFVCEALIGDLRLPFLISWNLYIVYVSHFMWHDCHSEFDCAIWRNWIDRTFLLFIIFFMVPFFFSTIAFHFVGDFFL